MRKLLDLWIETKDNQWALEPIYSFIKVLAGNLNGVSCELTNDCGNFLTIEYNGDITCCDFIPQRFTFGNVYKTDLKEIIVDSLAYKSFVAKLKIKPEECLSCSWQHLCGGGCLHYRKFDLHFQKWGKYVFCEQRKQLFDYIKQETKSK